MTTHGFRRSYMLKPILPSVHPSGHCLCAVSLTTVLMVNMPPGICTQPLHVHGGCIHLVPLKANTALTSVSAC